ncbi:MAG: hypothetical protein CBC29_08155 [Methylococcaceae bacterium TMED69]|nr:MAG: hypothetical protein CBC29_08155 [Methylococcaceae bacterium TMED69]
MGDYARGKIMLEKMPFIVSFTIILSILFLIFNKTVNALEIGEQAPNFLLPGSDGNTHSLSNLKGQWVVLAWFPKAFTGG